MPFTILISLSIFMHTILNSHYILNFFNIILDFSNFQQVNEASPFFYLVLLTLEYFIIYLICSIALFNNRLIIHINAFFEIFYKFFLEEIALFHYLHIFISIFIQVFGFFPFNLNLNF